MTSTCSRSWASHNANLGGSSLSAPPGMSSGCASTIPRATLKSCYQQGADPRRARFSRLEGAWWGDARATSSRPMAARSVKGQVFEYDPEGRDTQAHLRIATAADCENPDNLTVTPRGGLLLCEDNAGPTTMPASACSG